jgi:hypothetical protein
VRVQAQPTGSRDSTDIFKVNYWVSSGIIVSGIFTNSLSHKILRDKSGISAEQIDKITARGVKGFDSWSLRQDPFKKDEAAHSSNKLLVATVALPFLLPLDKRVRKEWKKVFIMYGEAHAVDANFYGWSPLGPQLIDRYRPQLYYEELPLEERNFGNLKNSFYSGHVSSAAVPTFFAAKVLSEFHPEWGNKKYIAYALAAIPPTVIGYYRIKALKHFPSDIIVGGIVGATIGILIPELHKKTKGKSRIGLLQQGDAIGVRLVQVLN